MWLWPRRSWFRGRSAAPCWPRHWPPPRFCRPDRLIDAPPAKADHAALLVQQNIPVSAEWTNPASLQQTLNELTELTVKSAASNPLAKIDLVVWPESPAPFFTNDRRFRDAVSAMARDTKAWTVAGAIGTASAAGAGRAEFSGVQLRRVGQPERRLDGALRQNPSRPFRRISPVPHRCLPSPEG